MTRKIWAVLALAILLTSTAQAEIVANLYEDYSAASNGVETSTGTWRYMWNRPDDWTGGSTDGAACGDITTAPLDDPSKFALMQNAPPIGWSGDGNTSGTNSNPDRYVRIGGPGADTTSLQIHPGAQANFDIGGSGDINGEKINSHDRYVIAAFTVKITGRYSVTDGVLWTGHANSDGVDVFAFAKDQEPVLLGDSRDVTEGESPGRTPENPFRFGHDVGILYPGETIYVAFGTNGHPGNDGSRTDFSIDRGPTGTRMLVR